jgi:hypothetical protein
MKKITLSLLAVIVLLVSCSKENQPIESTDNKVISELRDLNNRYKSTASKTNLTNQQWAADFGGALGGGSLCGPWCAIAFGVGLSALLLPPPQDNSNILLLEDINFEDFDSRDWYNEIIFENLTWSNSSVDFGAIHNFGLDIIYSHDDFKGTNSSSDIHDFTASYLEYLNNNYNYDIDNVGSNHDEFVNFEEVSSTYEKDNYSDFKIFIEDMQQNELISNEIWVDIASLYAEVLYENLDDAELNEYTNEFILLLSNSELSQSEKEFSYNLCSFALHSYSYWKNF